MTCVKHKAFTLIELLCVVAVIAIVAGLLYPALAHGKTRAVAARVQCDLRQIGIAIDAYSDDCGGLPPVRESCMFNAAIDYFEIPPELNKLGYLATHRMLDPFNTVRGEDGQEVRRTYKYQAINWGYSNNTKSSFGLLIPRDYPGCAQPCELYYKNTKGYAIFSTRKQTKPPIIWAVWSVGPAGDPGWDAVGTRELPVPKSEWYPANPHGIIVRLSDGRSSH